MNAVCAADLTGDMRALTIKQPWANLIVRGHKTVENRGMTFGMGFRGLLLVHAGSGYDENAESDPRVEKQLSYGMINAKGAFVGAVWCVDIHVENHCCKPWGDTHYPTTEFRPATHLVLDGARMLAKPVVARGRQGLWRPTPDQIEAVREQLP